MEKPSFTYDKFILEKPAKEQGRKNHVNRKRNRPGRPTIEEMERRKLKVLEVATGLFIRHGFAATPLTEIAKKSGVATRTLSQHFGDKEAIFREVVFARDSATIAMPVLEDGEELVVSLRKAAHYSYEVALRSRSIDLMRLMIAESTRFPDLMSQVATATFIRFTNNLSRLFRQLAERGRIPDGDHEESAKIFADLLIGNHTIMIYFGWVEAMPTENDVALKIDLFINGRFGRAI